MQAVNKVIKNVIDREQKRVLVIALSHDGEIMLKGDNLSVSTVENSECEGNAEVRATKPQG